MEMLRCSHCGTDTLRGPATCPKCGTPLRDAQVIQVDKPTSTKRLPEPVSVVDIRMPFWSMVEFMIKWAVAAIPAILILTVLGAVIIGVIVGLFAGLYR